MDLLFTYPSDTLIHAVGWALIHSLWQGAAVALLLAGVLRAFPGVGVNPGVASRRRYGVACVSLVTVVGLIVITFFCYADVGQMDRGRPVVADMAVVTELTRINVTPPLSTELLVTAEQTAGPFEWVERYLPWMVVAWLIGMSIVSLRLLTGWGVLRRMCYRDVLPINAALQGRVSALCQTMRVRRVVRVLESSRAVTPMVVGWVRPVILLPTASLTGLSSQQLEAVIAHELAHVLRHDYLVNLLQCVAETLLFYHPAVWWIGRVIRQERERCCDDLAVTVSGDRVDYARALLHIAESAPPHGGRLSVASQGGDLSSRVRRLLGIPSPTPQGRWAAGLWAAVASLCLVAVVVVGAQAESKSQTGEASEAQTIGGLTPTETSTGDQRLSFDLSPDDKKHVITVPYENLIKGDPAFNLMIQPGDVIRIPWGDRFVYIGGNIKRPGAYIIPDTDNLTLKQLIASAGGQDTDGPPLFVTLIRRIPPDQEETIHFSVDDLFGGWAQDAYLAPNDVILISDDSGHEVSEAAKERRLLRIHLAESKKALVDVFKVKEAIPLSHVEGRDEDNSLDPRIESIQKEIARIESELDGSSKQVGAETILPVSQPPPSAVSVKFDHITTYGPNNDAPINPDAVTVLIRRPAPGLPDQGGAFVIKRLGKELSVTFEGFTDLTFTNATVQHEKDGLINDEHMEIMLPGTTYIVVSPGSGKLSTHEMSGEGIHLLDALAEAGGVPDRTRSVQIIRHPSNE